MPNRPASNIRSIFHGGNRKQSMSNVAITMNKRKTITQIDSLFQGHFQIKLPLYCFKDETVVP